MSMGWKLPIKVWGISFVLIACGAMTSNPLLTVCAIALLPIFAHLLWRPGEPPVLFLACVLQWLQAVAGILYCDLYGATLWLRGGETLEKSTWLSLCAILVLAIAMRLVLPKQRTQPKLVSQMAVLREDRLFTLYLLSFFIFSFLGAVAFYISALTQIITAIISLKWAVIFLFAYAVFLNKKGYGRLTLVICLEVAVGFLGFFSGFKTIFFILLLALPAASAHIKVNRVILMGAIAVMMFFLCIFWSAIKVDYRDFLNQGAKQQVVVVSVSERISKLGELITELGPDDFWRGLDELLLRVTYVEYFSQVIYNVPENIDFEHGKLWKEAIVHVMTPRIFFPKKAALEDSERTSYYTGQEVSGVEQGTSIGIGYIGESYIDFGPIGMFCPIFGLGMFFGLVYRYFVFYQPIKVLGFGLATAVLMLGANNIETSNIKLVGGNLSAFLVLALFAKCFGSQIWKAITTPSSFVGKKPKEQIRAR
jgi:hypothetical protein